MHVTCRTRVRLNLVIQFGFGEKTRERPRQEVARPQAVGNIRAALGHFRTK